MEDIDLKKRALAKLIARRTKLQDAADELIMQPASYGITGSVSVTNRRVDELKKEIAEIDNQITSLLANTPTGMQIELPDYRRYPWQR